jgi:hypothetical protein
MLNQFPNTTHIYTVFDVPNNQLWRNDFYPAYKQNRKQRYATMSSEEAQAFTEFTDIQIPNTIEMLRKMGVHVIHPPQGLEADDMISVLASHADDSNTIIVSTDKDFYQLANPFIRVYNPATSSIVYTDPDTGALCSDSSSSPLATSPLNYLFMRAAIGDASDNIQGIRGMGPVRSSMLFRSPVTSSSELYGSYALRNQREWRKTAIGCTLLNYQSIIHRNLVLMALVPPYSMLGLSRLIQKGETVSDVVESLLTIADEAENTTNDECLVYRGVPITDPCEFLRYFRRLEFAWALHPNEFSPFWTALSRLR